MSGFKGTPGPWAVTSQYGDVHSQARNGQNWISQGPIYAAPSSPMPEEAAANALLIAAAPDLLAACEFVALALNGRVHSTQALKAIAMAREAAARALGTPASEGEE